MMDARNRNSQKLQSRKKLILQTKQFVPPPCHIWKKSKVYYITKAFFRFFSILAEGWSKPSAKRAHKRFEAVVKADGGYIEKKITFYNLLK